MRVLCLHGVGSSGRILESQLRQFLQEVDPTYEFVFVDGAVASERGPGVGLHIEGPFFSHMAGYAPEQMAEALDHFATTLDELGPFDGILGFSQGAALTISYLHHKQNLEEQIPFKFALCISSVIPCSADPEYCQDIVESLIAQQRDVAAPIPTEDASLTRDERIFMEMLQRTIVPAKKNKAMLPDYSLKVYSSGSGSYAPRIMNPQLLKSRIQIPTIHVTGKRDHDFMRNMSTVAHDLCEKRLTRKLEHSGGHHPPQKRAEVSAVIRALDWAIRQAEKSPGARL